jgi:hypothetical protein
MFPTAQIFSGLASILRCETRKPNNLPPEIPKTKFLGLSIMHVENNLSKTRARSRKIKDRCLVLSTMSSTYTSIIPRTSS